MKFTKMEGLGNDYIYVNCFRETVKDPKSMAIRYSDRHFGISPSEPIPKWRSLTAIASFSGSLTVSSKQLT